MNLQPKSYDKIIQLMNKGVDIPNPSTLDIGGEVKVDCISGKGVKIYPGCRIYGEKTIISAGTQIGYEGPATIDNCQIGPNVELKGGYFHKSVFLEKSNMGFGAHVREGCILEEQANGAHCVGLKQTILFPFVTLGSLINFCDCLMAGGTSRKDHSEVGSSYIHFNFTPDGDKTTASLLGDVPRGVMLNQPPIFLGGQGGIVGPVRLGYGNIVAAGTILRKDVTEEGKLIFAKSPSGAIIQATPRMYPGLSRVVANNLIYLANLIALQQWYVHVRQPFFQTQEFGDPIYAGVLDTLALARKERIKRLRDLADKVKDSCQEGSGKNPHEPGRREFYSQIDRIQELFARDGPTAEIAKSRDHFLSALETHKKERGARYIECIQSLPLTTSSKGVQWLEDIVAELCSGARKLVPSFDMFNK